MLICNLRTLERDRKEDDEFKANLGYITNKMNENGAQWRVLD